MEDYQLLEKLAHQNRERIPERTVHAKGVGAFGTLTVTHDITRFTRAKLFSEVGKKTEIQARSRCGMIFQDAEDHLFMPTLLDDVAFGPLNQGCDAGEAQRRAGDAIAQVGLLGLELRSAHHMSGGQKRAAALATVLAMQVKLLLLDEPAANLDCRSRRRLIEVLDRRGEALLLATHDLPLIRRLCSRAILIDEGRIVADRPTADLLADGPLLAAHGLVD